MIAIVQAIAATVGVAQTSIQGAIRRQYGITWALVALVAVLSVNVMTLAADIQAGAESLKLLFGVPRAIFVLPFAAGVAWLLLIRSYRRVESILAFLPIIFVAYGISAILAKPDWIALLHSLVLPRFNLSMPVVTGALALLGTTLTSYVYYWEQIEVSERRTPRAHARWAKADAAWGALAPVICFLFILVATAATLGKGYANVQTATDAAVALQPLAGRWATALFAIGLFASAAIAVPIIAATSAYVVTQTFDWTGSLDAHWREAPIFYAVLLGSLGLSAAFALAGSSPIALLYAASIAGGLATPLTLWLLLAIARNRAIMGESRIGGQMFIGGAAVATLVTASCGLFLVLAFRGF